MVQYILQVTETSKLLIRLCNLCLVYTATLQCNRHPLLPSQHVHFPVSMLIQAASVYRVFLQHHSVNSNDSTNHNASDAALDVTGLNLQR
jgi:hypothetical protein